MGADKCRIYMADPQLWNQKALIQQLKTKGCVERVLLHAGSEFFPNSMRPGYIVTSNLPYSNSTYLNVNFILKPFAISKLLFDQIPEYYGPSQVDT